MIAPFKFLFPLLVIAICSGCKFNDPEDLTQPLPELEASAYSLSASSEVRKDTIYNGTVGVPVPNHMIASAPRVNEAMGVNLPLTWFSQDSTVNIEVRYTDELSEGDVSAENLTAASEALQTYLTMTYAAEIITNRFETVNNREFLILDANLNWNDRWCSTTIYATIVDGKIFVYNLRYPNADREATKDLRRKILEQITFFAMA